MELKILKLILIAIKLRLDLLLMICSGYVALVYVMFGQFSIKSDVFSFGVLILEIMSGKKNTSYHNGENMWVGI